MTEPDDRLFASVTALSGLLLSDETVESVLDRVVHLARDLVPGCDHVGLTLFRDHQPTTPAATDELALKVDGLQYGRGIGPCLEAALEAHTVRVEDLAKDTRFDGFAVDAVALGIRSSLSLPLAVRGETVAALNLYAVTPGAFTDLSELIGERFAEQAAVALANAQVHNEAVHLVAQLNEALASRAVIERAKGILMAREGCGEEKAFDILRRASQRENRKVREIAESIILAAEELAARNQHGMTPKP